MTRRAESPAENNLNFRADKRKLACVVAALLALAAAQVRADIKVEISGVEGPMRDNVLAYLSLQRYAKRDDLDGPMIERLFLRATDEAKDALRPFGYYEPRIHSHLDPSGKNWRVKLRIEPGTPIILAGADLKVSGPGADDDAFRRVIDQSSLSAGTRLNHAEYERTKGELQRTAAAIGYLDARVIAGELRVDPAAHVANAVLELDTGPRYRFGKTTIEQDAIDTKLFLKYLRYHEHDFYDAVAIFGTQFALDDSQYFSVVEVTPGERDSATLTVPINIKAEPVRRNRYSIGVGYGTDTKFRGTLGWDDRRINSAGHRSRVAIKASSVLREISGQYLIPVGDPAFEKLSLDATIKTEQLADADTSTVELRPGLTQVLGRWQRVLFVRFTHTTTETPTLPKSTANLVIPGISFAPLGGTTLTQAFIGRGFFAELTGSTHLLGSDSDYLRLDVQDEKVFDLSPRWHLITRGELGLSRIGTLSDLPASERFFAGGDRSVRGFALNELSPLDADGNKTGGRYLIVGSVEIERDLPKRFAIAAFVDAGNAVNKLSDPLEYSVGIGFRWKLPVLSVGIDIAQALSENVGPRLHLNITPNLK
jgi:translocation and assembly module TamA